jgi:hypothetical protein
MGNFREILKKSKVRKRDKIYLRKLIDVNPSLQTFIEKFELIRIKTVKL